MRGPAAPPPRRPAAPPRLRSNIFPGCRPDASVWPERPAMYDRDMFESATRRAAAGDADLAAVGRLLAEPARTRMLLALDDGRALPASVLAAEAGVAPSTASEHLATLVEGGLLRVEPQGRHRYYFLRGPEIGALIEAVAAVAPPQRVRSLRPGTRAAALRAARTCYDHLAGRLGVAVFDALLTGHHVAGGDGNHHRERNGPGRPARPR